MGRTGKVQIKFGSCQAALHARTQPGAFAAPATRAVSGAALTPATPAPTDTCTSRSLIWIDSSLEQQSMQQCALFAPQMRHAYSSNPCNHAICMTHRCHMHLSATNSKAHAMSWRSCLHTGHWDFHAQPAIEHLQHLRGFPTCRAELPSERRCHHHRSHRG